MTILAFIDTLKSTDKFIVDIFSFGGCYRLHLLLKALYPSCIPFIRADKDHVITKYRGKFYDITGQVSGSGYSVMTLDEIEIASTWSFSKQYVLQIGECPHCEEPLIVS